MLADFSAFQLHFSDAEIPSRLKVLALGETLEKIQTVPDIAAPHHLICIVGNAGQESLTETTASTIASLDYFSGLKSASFMAPLSAYGNNGKLKYHYKNKMLQILNSNGSNLWIHRGNVDISYSKDDVIDERKVLCFMRSRSNDLKPARKLSIDEEYIAKLSYKKAKEKFGSLIGGTLNSPLSTIIDIAGMVGIDQGDIVFDQGCGNLILMSVMSSLTGQLALGCDLDDVLGHLKAKANESESEVAKADLVCRIMEKASESGMCYSKRILGWIHEKGSSGKSVEDLTVFFQKFCWDQGVRKLVGLEEAESAFKTVMNTTSSSSCMELSPNVVGHLFRDEDDIASPEKGMQLILSPHNNDNNEKISSSDQEVVLNLIKNCRESVHLEFVFLRDFASTLLGTFTIERLDLFNRSFKDLMTSTCIHWKRILTKGVTAYCAISRDGDNVKKIMLLTMTRRLWLSVRLVIFTIHQLYLLVVAEQNIHCKGSNNRVLTDEEMNDFLKKHDNLSEFVRGLDFKELKEVLVGAGAQVNGNEKARQKIDFSKERPALHQNIVDTAVINLSALTRRGKFTTYNVDDVGSESEEEDVVDEDEDEDEDEVNNIEGESDEDGRENDSEDDEIAIDNEDDEGAIDDGGSIDNEDDDEGAIDNEDDGGAINSEDDGGAVDNEDDGGTDMDEETEDKKDIVDVMEDDDQSDYHSSFKSNRKCDNSVVAPVTDDLDDLLSGFTSISSTSSKTKLSVHIRLDLPGNPDIRKQCRDAIRTGGLKEFLDKVSAWQLFGKYSMADYSINTANGACVWNAGLLGCLFAQSEEGHVTKKFYSDNRQELSNIDHVRKLHAFLVKLKDGIKRFEALNDRAFKPNDEFHILPRITSVLEMLKERIDANNSRHKKFATSIPADLWGDMFYFQHLNELMGEVESKIKIAAFCRNSHVTSSDFRGNWAVLSSSSIFPSDVSFGVNFLKTRNELNQFMNDYQRCTSFVLHSGHCFPMFYTDGLNMDYNLAYELAFKNGFQLLEQKLRQSHVDVLENNVSPLNNETEFHQVEEEEDNETEFHQVEEEDEQSFSTPSIFKKGGHKKANCLSSMSQHKTIFDSFKKKPIEALQEKVKQLTEQLHAQDKLKAAQFKQALVDKDREIERLNRKCDELTKLQEELCAKEKVIMNLQQQLEELKNKRQKRRKN